MFRHRQREAEFLRARIAEDRRQIHDAGSRLRDSAESLLPKLDPDAAGAWVSDHPKRSVAAGAALGFLSGRIARPKNPARRAARRARLAAYRKRLASTLSSAALSLGIRYGSELVHALKNRHDARKAQGKTNERVGDTSHAPPPTTTPA